MKHTFSFTLSATDDEVFEVRQEIERIIKINSYTSLIWEFEQWLREQIKYNDKPFEEVREKWYELKNQEDLPEG